jgi:hypothetical protein
VTVPLSTDGLEHAISGIRYEQAFAESQVLMPWRITEGPYDAPWSGRDAVGWRWRVRNDRGDVHPITVWVSGTAMAVAAEFLPSETAAARETDGRSEVERLLQDEILPRELMLHTEGRSIDPGEAGWWVELRGDDRALQALARLFATDELRITQRGGQHFLRSTEFEEMTHEQEVRLRAAGLLRQASGAAWLESESTGSVEVGAVQRFV